MARIIADGYGQAKQIQRIRKQRKGRLKIHNKSGSLFRGGGTAARFCVAVATRIAANGVAVVIDHRPATADFPVAHTLAGKNMDAAPDAEKDDQSNNGDDSIE